MNLGPKISQLCKMQNISPTKLAKLINVKQSLISQVINDKRGLSLGNIEKICGVFNIPLSDFFSTDKEIDLNMNSIVDDLKTLDNDEIDGIKTIIRLIKKNKP